MKIAIVCALFVGKKRFQKMNDEVMKEKCGRTELARTVGEAIDFI
jgi:hypothetical protein